MLSRFGVKELRCIWCIFSPSTTVCLPALLQTVFARRSSSPKPVNIYWPTYTKMPPWTSTLILRKKAIDLCSPVGKLKHMVPHVQRPGTLQKCRLHVHLQHCFPPQHIQFIFTPTSATFHRNDLGIPVNVSSGALRDLFLEFIWTRERGKNEKNRWGWREIDMQPLRGRAGLIAVAGALLTLTQTDVWLTRASARHRTTEEAEIFPRRSVRGGRWAADSQFLEVFFNDRSSRARTVAAWATRRAP